MGFLRANVDPAAPLQRGSRNGVLEQCIVNAAGTIPDQEDKMRAQLKWVVGLNPLEICVTNADGTHLVQRTDNALFEGTRDVVSRWAESRTPEPGGANPTLLCNVVTALAGSWSLRR